MSNKEIVISSKGNTWGVKISDLLSYRNLLYMLVKRDFITQYKQTILGPIWFLIQPLISAMAYLIIFGRLADLGTDSIPQVLFYFSGTILWTFFTEVLNKTSRVFVSNKELFGKVYFPRSIVPFSYVIGGIIKLSIQLLLFAAMYIYYIIRNEISFSGWKIFVSFLVILWISLLSTGLGMIITSITTKYRDIAIALEFFISLLMYGTPVVYPMSETDGLLRFIIELNPLTAPVEMFRYSFFGVFTAPLWSVLYSLVIAIVIMLYGMLIFGKNEQIFIDVI